MEENEKPKVYQLSKPVAEKYDLIGGQHPTKAQLAERWGGEEVDWRTMTLEKADQLAAIPNFPYLKLKNPPAAAAAEASPVITKETSKDGKKK